MGEKKLECAFIIVISLSFPPPTIFLDSYPYPHGIIHLFTFRNVFFHTQLSLTNTRKPLV